MDQSEDYLNEIFSMLSYPMIYQSNPTNDDNDEEEDILFNILLNRSLNDKSQYKKIISEEGLTQLTTIKYDKNKDNTITSCPIMCVDFEDSEEITQLPCNHYFNKAGILKWLKEEKAECPVCRFQLKYNEVKIENVTPRRASSQIENYTDIRNEMDIARAPTYAEIRNNTDINSARRNLRNSFFRLQYNTYMQQYNNYIEHPSLIYSRMHRVAGYYVLEEE
jgi:hypothetical protein